MIHKEDNEMKFKKVAALVLASAMTLGQRQQLHPQSVQRRCLFVGHHLQQRH